MVQTDYGEVALALKSGKYWHLNSTAAQILMSPDRGDARALRMFLATGAGWYHDVKPTIASLHREGIAFDDLPVHPVEPPVDGPATPTAFKAHQPRASGPGTVLKDHDVTH